MKKNSFWSFEGKLSNIFDNHIKRSVPFYEEGHLLITRVADNFITPKATVYDLGCSTGKLLQLLAKNPKYTQVKFIGVDQSAGMISAAQKNCRGYNNIKLIQTDINSYSLESAELIIAYFTLHFLPAEQKLYMLKKIYAALKPGGAFLFFEKVTAEDGQTENILSQVLIDFKLDEGFSSEEIVEKQQQLKGIIHPQTSRENLQQLTTAGFSNPNLIMKYASFEGYLASKKNA